MNADLHPAGTIHAVSGSVIQIDLHRDVALGEIVHVGHGRLLGEVIELREQSATAQVYEDTAGLAARSPVFATGRSLEVELGPGLLGGVFDGLQRPLARLADTEGDFLRTGHHVAALDRQKLWPFVATLRAGDAVGAGAVIGTVAESKAVEHRVLVPPAISGVVAQIADAGPRRVTDIVATIVDAAGTAHQVKLMQTWRVRRARPCAGRLPSAMPMLTGQRVLDTFFPLPRGGACGMPGGFGTGKTIMQQQLCQWADADVIVYVGCGERGNEMTEMLTRLPHLTDPRTGAPLAERTILVANTSNMPVPAREASIYTGVTMAEYFRDMGYHVALLADSTSRWAEALRDISGRLGEIPAEEGYPPYLASRLASYYERAARVRTLGGAEGSVTLISAISPPGGDLTEPVTRHTQRFTQCFWTLDKTLAEARLFPAIGLRDSYSHLPDALVAWWVDRTSAEWPSLRSEALTLLEDAARAEAAARLVGVETLPERQQWLLEMARLFEEGFLRQNALDAADGHCSPERQFKLLRLLMHTHRRGLAALDRGATTRGLARLPVMARVAEAKTAIPEHALDDLDRLQAAIDAECRTAEAVTAGRDG